MDRREFLQGMLGMGAAMLSPAWTFAARNKYRVVIVGGGFGGLTAARYLKRFNPNLDVLLVERNDKFVSCAISNWVLVDKIAMQDITFGYDSLARRGITVIHDEIVGVDTGACFIQGKQHKIDYDRLIVSPGISFRDELIEGYDDRVAEVVPHAYHAGHQTLELRRRLIELPPGGTVLMTVPASPYRCPPGPYERASLIADFLKRHKPGSRLIVVDPHEKIASKTALFQSAWDAYYPDIIDYRPNQTVVAVDPAQGSISTRSGAIHADVINLIPSMKAADLAFDLGLVPKGELWAPVKPRTLESTLASGVYVIGDATDARTSGPMPKSGYVANSMGKAAAAAIVAALAGKQPPIPWFMNTCYSMVTMNEAIYITGVYHYDEAADANVTVAAGSKVSNGRSLLYGRYAEDWGPAIWSDMLG